MSPAVDWGVHRRDIPLFDIERGINRLSTEERPAVRAARSAPLLADLKALLRAERAAVPLCPNRTRAMDYTLKRWPGFTRFLGDGRVYLTNNAAERTLRGIALGHIPGCSTAPTAAATRPRSVHSNRHRQD